MILSYVKQLMTHRTSIVVSAIIVALLSFAVSPTQAQAHETGPATSTAKTIPTEQPVDEVANSTPAQEQAQPTNSTYTVKSGDTLNKIARAQRVDGGWRKLWEDNKHNVPNPHRIYVGQVLNLPGNTRQIPTNTVVQNMSVQQPVQQAAEAPRPRVVSPIKASTTSCYGNRGGTFHHGIDFGAPMRTPQYAAMDGVVKRAGTATGFGLAVYIEHEGGIVTVYGHMEKILVSNGQPVKAGDTIALTGNRGQSTGPHLHFEVHKGGNLYGNSINPAKWLRDNGVAVTGKC
ncbi:MAG TPA: peptidoglycan DD-metalloendopeptidase family protein [Candidatus Saccharimonadales bacterium]|nr:peptidoglycan DD-metalloendopeptidase family protein [Candidatus Saccharimonadales bacterium]